ncbi:MAG: energy transducer TonB [Bacteroidales bacterium]|nr:energy transducer TonB [Bacteroidales bacterium]
MKQLIYILLLLPLLLMGIQPVSAQTDSSEVFVVVEDSPQFPGGEEARVEYLQKNIIYPEEAEKNGIEGTVYVTFIVETDGSISNVRLLRGIGGGCDKVAFEAVQNMPDWKPGKQKGRPVRVQFNMPLKFKLDDKVKKEGEASQDKEKNKE